MGLKRFLSDKMVRISVLNILLTVSVATVASFAWFSAARNVNNEGIEIYIDGVGTTATLETFHYHTNSPANESEIYGELITDNNGNPLNVVDLYTHESIFRYRNIYTPIIHRVGISGIEKGNGQLTLKINRRATEDNKSDYGYSREELPHYISSAINFKYGVDSTIYDSDDNVMFNNALNKLSDIEDKHCFTSYSSHPTGEYEQKLVYGEVQDNQSLPTTANSTKQFYVKNKNDETYWRLSGSSITYVSSIDEAQLFNVKYSGSYYTFEYNGTYIGYTRSNTTCRYSIGTSTPTAGWTSTGNSSGYGFYNTYKATRSTYYWYLGNPTSISNSTTITSRTSTSTSFNFFTFATRSMEYVDDLDKPIYSDPAYFKETELSFDVNYTSSDFNNDILYVYFMVDYDEDLVNALTGSTTIYSVGSDITLANDLASIYIYTE